MRYYEKSRKSVYARAGENVIRNTTSGGIPTCPGTLCYRNPVTSYDSDQFINIRIFNCMYRILRLDASSSTTGLAIRSKKSQP